MTTLEQLAERTARNSEEIAALREHSKSAHKRIDRMDKLTAGVHELAQSVTAVATEMKLFAQKFDKSIERIEQGQRSQGERIGGIERTIQQIERNEKEIAEHAAKIDNLRQEPAEKWKELIRQLITLLVAGGLGGLITSFFL